MLVSHLRVDTDDLPKRKDFSDLLLTFLQQFLVFVFCLELLFVKQLHIGFCLPPLLLLRFFALLSDFDQLFNVNLEVRNRPLQ